MRMTRQPLSPTALCLPPPLSPTWLVVFQGLRLSGPASAMATLLPALPRSVRLPTTLVSCQRGRRGGGGESAGQMHFAELCGAGLAHAPPCPPLPLASPGHPTR